MAIKKPSKIRFPELLSKAPGLLWEGWRNSEVFRELQIQELQEDIARVDALCAEREIQPGSTMYLVLALQLAREAYPEAKKAGRNKVWNDLTYGVLVVEVERLKGKGDAVKPLTWVCKKLAKQPHWLKFLSQRDDPDCFSTNPSEALRKAYNSYIAKMKKNWELAPEPKPRLKAAAFRDMYSLHQLEGTVEEWDKFVVDVLKTPMKSK